MKIHFFVRTLNDKSGGGSHYNSLAYIRALRAHGHFVAVHVFSNTQSNSFPPDVEPIVHKGWGMSFRRSRTYLAELLKQYQPDADVFFLYAVEFCWGGGLYRKQGGKTPAVVYMDAYLPSMGAVKPRSLKDWIYRMKRLPWDKTQGLRDASHIDRFLPCSPYIGEVYKAFGFPKEKFTVLPNIVPDQSVKHVDGGSAAIRIIYLGRLIYEKGIDLLIDALASLTEFPWALTVVGDGPMRAYVEDRVQKENLPVTMTGWVPQKETARYYADADLFVLPARWPDPAPRAIVDALYAGLPVVVPDTGGSSWIAGEAGLVFKTGNPESLKAHLRSFMEDSGMQREWLRSHSAAEVAKFSEAAVYPQLEEILKKMIEKKK